MTRKECLRKYYQTHKESINAQKRTRYSTSAEIREKQKQRCRAYYQANRERLKEQAERRRAKRIELLKRQLGGIKL